MAEQVDALDSKSSGVKPVPVRFRPDVQNERGRACLPLFLLSFKYLYSPRLYNNTTDKLCFFDTFLIAGQQNAFAIPQKSVPHSSIFRNEKR